MTIYVALLRGINLVSTNRIAMPALRSLFADLGHADVRTHLQTGNVIFTAPRVKASDLEKRIAADLGVKTTVLLRTAGQMAKIVAANPFAGGSADPARLLVTFLSDKPGSDRAAGLDGLAAASEAVAVVGQEAYLHCPNGYGRSKL